MSLQEQHGENLRQAQEAWVKAVESWTNGVRSAVGQSSTGNPFMQGDPNAFIDQYFDLAQKTLEGQREVAKNMAKATLSMGENLRKQAESAGQSVQEVANSASNRGHE
jgi:hypothetical protein